VANKQLTLSIESRDKTGTTSARKVRASGKVPAVLYGHGDTPEHIALDARAFEDILHRGGRTSMITLEGSDKKGETVLVRDVQRHQVSHKILHADLLRVSANESVHTKLPVVTVGVALGVREFGAVMDVIVHELEIEGPANRLPESIEIDVSALGLHEHLTAGSIKLPDGFKMLTPADMIVVAIEPSKTAQAVEEAEAGVAIEQAEPEVIGGKPDEAAAPSGDI
jgi:large subunit ribosomal protein L25